MLAAYLESGNPRPGPGSLLKRVMSRVRIRPNWKKVRLKVTHILVFGHVGEIIQRQTCRTAGGNGEKHLREGRKRERELTKSRHPYDQIDMEVPIYNKRTVCV